MNQDHSDTGMVALVPSKYSSKNLVVSNGLSVNDLHLTLLYLGDINQYSEDAKSDLIDRLSLGARNFNSFYGNAFSIENFNPHKPDKSCVVLGISGAELDDVKQMVTLETNYLSSIIPEQYKPWHPHITLTYNDVNEDLTDKLGPIKFDRLLIKFGNTPYYISLTGEEEKSVVDHMYFLVDLSKTANLSEGDSDTTKWVHAIPIGNYNHPRFGKIVITAERAKKLADSVINKVRGIDPSINYDHNNSGPAAGWVKGAEARSDGTWLLVDFVKEALQAIKDKKYRYFSAEYYDLWEDPEGKEFQDVIFGGALTNRPFMKNLVPINLSEATYDSAFELVGAVTGKDVESLRGGEKVELSEDQLNKIIEGVSAKLKPAEGEKGEEKKASLNLSEVAELKALAEENPLVAALISKVETQGVDIVSTQRELSESKIARQLSEFDKSKLVLTPVAKKLVYKILNEMPDSQHNDFWELMTHMRKSQSFLVDLSERAGVAVKYGVDRSPAKRFSELVNKELANGVPYADAVTKVASEDPALYEEYRQESFSFKA